MKIDYLVHHPQYIPILAQWFHRQWGYLYPQRTLEEVQQTIAQRDNTDKIPLALVAIDGDELIGTVCIKHHDMDTHMNLSPWLAGLYVAPARRGQGLGKQLVHEIEQKAGELGIDRLYLYTPESEGFYLELGWQLVERTDYHGHSVSLMTKALT